jgi:hypothetical protein
MVGGMGYNIFTIKDVAFTDQGYGMSGDLKRTDKFDISLELALWGLYNSRYDEDEASEFLDQMESDSEIAFEDIQEELNEIWEKEENERQTRDAESKKVYGVKGQVTINISVDAPSSNHSNHKAELKYDYDVVADVDLPFQPGTPIVSKIVPVDFNLTDIKDPNDFDKALGRELSKGLESIADLEMDKIYNSNPFKVSFDFIPYNKQKPASMKYILYQSPKNNKYYITSKGIGIENLRLFWDSKSLNYKSMTISKTASSGHRYTVDAVKDIALNRSNCNQNYLALDDEDAYNKFIVPNNKMNIAVKLGLRLLFLVDYHVDLEITEGSNKTKKVDDYSGSQKIKEFPAKLI